MGESDPLALNQFGFSAGQFKRLIREAEVEGMPNEGSGGTPTLLLRRERTEPHSPPANCNRLRGSCSPVGELVTQPREARSGLKVELLQTGHIFK